jgi:DNA-binding MarR family transcriptional regulator
MIILAEMAPERMTLSQAIFFLMTAIADLSGKQPTFSDIKEAVGTTINRSLHTTYRILLAKSRVYPNGLGWLRQELNPNDNREKFLRLTPKGRTVMLGVLRELEEGPFGKG